MLTHFSKLVALMTIIVNRVSQGAYGHLTEQLLSQKRKSDCHTGFGRGSLNGDGGRKGGIQARVKRPDQASVGKGAHRRTLSSSPSLLSSGKALAIACFLKEGRAIEASSRDPRVHRSVDWWRASSTRLRRSEASRKPQRAVLCGGGDNVGTSGPCPASWPPGTWLSLSVLVKKSHRARPDQQTQRKR